MNHFEELLQRTRPECLVEYLLTGTTDRIQKQTPATYEESIELASEQFLDTLERLAPALNRQNEALLTAIAAFFTGITDVYMEMGLLAGAELMKNLEKADWKLKGQRKPGVEALGK